MDLDWRAILDKAIDIGGPIAAKVVDVEAPGAGTAIGLGLPILKQQVVDMRIEIDAARQAREVAQITETDYFRELQEKAQRQRDQHHSPEESPDET